MYRLTFFLCLLTLATKADAAPCTLPSDHPLIGQTYWYGLYYEDKKIGHAMSAIDQVEDGGNTVLDHRFEMTFKLEQAEETIMQFRHFEAVSPHGLIKGRYQTADRSIEYVLDGQDLVMVEDGAERVWEGVERTLCDEEDIALFRFLETAPSIGDKLTTADFDVENLMMLATDHEIQDVSTRKIFGADHIFHKVLSSSDNEVFSYNAVSQYRNGEGVNFFLGPIELRAETEAIAREPNIGVDLFAEFEKPLNEPLADLAKINDLILMVRIDDPATSIDQVIDDRFLQRVEYQDKQSAIVRLGDYPAPVNFDEPEAFLKPTSIHPSDDPRIQSLAGDVQAAVANPNDHWALALALMKFVADYIEDVPQSPYVYHTTSVFDILDNRTGDCTEHSQLFVTLAKSLGLPAREVTGYVYSGDDQAPSLSGHAWVEVLIDDRWRGLDPTWGEAELNRSHVQIKNDLVLGLSFEVMDINYW